MPGVDIYIYDALLTAAAQGKLTQEEIRELQLTVERKRQSRFSIILTIVIVLGGVSIISDLDVWIVNKCGLPTYYSYIIDGLLFLCFLTFYKSITLFYEPKTMRSYIAWQLKLRNVRPSFCLICEYDLHGTEANHCPECGEQLAPKS